MAKQSGLGDALYVAGYDLSGDIGSLGRISGGTSPLEVTGINKSAMERIGGLRDGGLEYAGYFNPTAGQLHDRAGNLPTTDQIVSYFRGTAIGSPAASLVSKQLNYDGTRGNDGALTFSVSCESNAYGIDWGAQLTAGKRTDTAATNGTGLDQTTVSTSFGWQAFLHVFAFTGTSVTVAIEDSADGAAWAALAGGAFTAATGITSERIAGGSTATVRRHVRVVTTGTFSNAVFAVAFTRNETAVTF